MNSKRVLGKQAIVVGSNVAGLLSARILADYFDSVIILEKEFLSNDNNQFSPIPTLVAKAYQILDSFFPNIGYTLIQRGALGIDWAREFQIFGYFGWGQNSQVPSRIISIICTKTLLETTIKEVLLDSHSNVRLISCSSIESFSYDTNHDRLVGINVVNNGLEQFFDADLVIDTDVNSSTPQYLENIGFSSPPETIINPLITCAVRRYEISTNFPDNLKAMLIRPFPPDRTQVGCLGRVEGNEFVVALGEYGSEFSCNDEVSFLRLAQNLPSQRLYDIITQATPTSEIRIGQVRPNRLRYYNKIRLPNNLIVLGNAVCLLSPLYGQDTTIDILGVDLLKNLLEENKPFSSFANSLANFNSFFWSLATNLDLRFESTTFDSSLENARRPEPQAGLVRNLTYWYSRELVNSTTYDSDLYTLWLEVIHLLKPPTEFFNPLVIAKVVTSARY
jgi:hypothetical protein